LASVLNKLIWRN